MKKLLTILTGLSIIVTPATQIVSCKITSDNTFKSFKDIEKFWGTKTHNTIVFNKDTIEADINTEIKQIIANNFINQEYVNKIFGIGDDKNDKTNIEFQFYKTNTGFPIGKDNESEKIQLANEEEITDPEPIIDYLNKSFNESKHKTIPVYFKYKEIKEDGTETEFNKKYLELKFTNIPEMTDGVYKDEGENGIFGNIENTIKIEKYFFNDLSNLIDKTQSKEVNLDFLEKNKTATIKFIKGILKAIKEASENQFDLSNSLEWIDVKNPHNEEKNYEWKVLSPEAKLYKDLITPKEEAINPNFNGFIELINKFKSSTEWKTTNKDYNWLGLEDKTFVLTE
ncbi:lipoprotein [Spiroplasma endosymbiont of Cantharis lateralis]|uniref:lipoprotein n=1 Tax=Spiroplasma endosymbiont of Cantharis lateralis TaxID=3066277 RepID=UPI00313DFCF3